MIYSRWRAALLIAIAGLLPVTAAIIHGEVIGPFEQVAPMTLQGARDPSGTWDVLQADGVLQFYVWRDLVFSSYGSAGMPFWNPYQLMGTPLLANSQSGALYPLHILGALSGLSTGVLINLLAWFHLSWAGLGAYFLARRIGASHLGALIGGTGFALSPFMLGWLALASVPATVSWIPWVLGTAIAIVQADRRVGLWMAALAGCVGMMLLGGHLQFAAYGLLALAVVALWVGIGERRPMRVAFIAGAAILGGMLAAPQVLPTLEFSKSSHRMSVASEEGYGAYAASAIQPYELLGIAYPAALGLPVESIAGGMPAHWPMYVKRGANFAESAIGVGPLLLVIALFWRKRPGAALAAVGGVGVLALLLAIGTPLARFMYFGLPGWSATGSPGRAGVLVALALAVAGAACWPREDEEWHPKWPVVGVLGVGVASLLGVVLWVPTLSSWIPNLPFELSQVTAQSLAITTARVLSITALAALAVRLANSKPLSALACAIGSFVFAALAIVQSGSAPAVTQPDQPAQSRTAYVNEAWSLFVAAPALNPPNLSTLSRVPDIAGYDSLMDRETVERLKGIVGRDPAPEANGNMMFIKPGFDEAALAEHGVGTVWVRDPETGQPRSRTLATPGRVSSEGGPARIVKERLDRIVVEVPAGRLILRDRNLPGWRASDSQGEIPIEPGFFRTVTVRAPGRVVFSYEPPGFRLGLSLFAIAAALSAILAIFGARRASGT